jgi:hypothetical protein
MNMSWFFFFNLIKKPATNLSMKLKCHSLMDWTAYNHNYHTDSFEILMNFTNLYINGYVHNEKHF